MMFFSTVLRVNQKALEGSEAAFENVHDPQKIPSSTEKVKICVSMSELVSHERKRVFSPQWLNPHVHQSSPSQSSRHNKAVFGLGFFRWERCTQKFTMSRGIIRLSALRGPRLLYLPRYGGRTEGRAGCYYRMRSTNVARTTGMLFFSRSARSRGIGSSGEIFLPWLMSLRAFFSSNLLSWTMLRVDKNRCLRVVIQS